MQTVGIQKVTFYDDQVRSWKTPEGRVFVVLRDPCLALGIAPQMQIEHLRQDPLFEGFLNRNEISVLRETREGYNRGASNVHRDDSATTPESHRAGDDSPTAQ